MTTAQKIIKYFAIILAITIIVNIIGAIIYSIYIIGRDTRTKKFKRYKLLRRNNNKHR